MNTYINWAVVFVAWQLSWQCHTFNTNKLSRQKTWTETLNQQFGVWDAEMLLHISMFGITLLVLKKH